VAVWWLTSPHGCPGAAICTDWQVMLVPLHARPDRRLHPPLPPGQVAPGWVAAIWHVPGVVDVELTQFRPSAQGCDVLHAAPSAA
jgi:hypothetical protein